MKDLRILMAVVFVSVLAVTAFINTSASAGILGNGSAITDTLQIGKITSVGNKSLKIATEFEKESKSYSLSLLPECYVINANTGEFRKFSSLKKGELIAAYGWYRNGKWNARRIDVLDPNDYLVKRLAKDAKAGVYFKHER